VTAGVALVAGPGVLAQQRGSAAIAASSARSIASMYCCRTARSSSVGSVDGAHSIRCADSCCFIVGRARCNALFTDATLDSSSPAVSLADQPSRSRKINTARCLGGRC
jgi:hypothetical protein